MSEMEFDPSVGVGGAEEGVVEPENDPGVSDPGAAEETPVEPEAEAASPWAPSADDWNSLTSTVQALAQQMQPAPELPQAPEFVSTDELGDSYVDPEQLTAYINYQIEQGVNQRIGNYMPVLDQTVSDRGEVVINQHFDQAEKTVGGDFDRTLARAIAEGYSAQGMDPRQAVLEAAKVARSARVSEREAGVSEYKTTLENIGKAPREAGAAGAAHQTEERPEGVDPYKWVSDNWAARHGA